MACDAIAPCKGKSFTDWYAKEVPDLKLKTNEIGACVQKTGSKCISECKTSPYSSKCTKCMDKLCPGYANMASCASCVGPHINANTTEAEGGVITWNYCTSCGKAHPVKYVTKKKKHWILIGLIILGVILVVVIATIMMRSAW